MFKVGLTGGIGSGKSTVAERFAQLGAGVIDTDLLARELTEPGTAILARIAGEFAAILQPDGQLDRAALRALVFADPAARRRLEAILHPPIRALMLERAARLPTPYALLMIPLLFETGQETLVDRVLALDCPEELQIERVCRRSALSVAEVSRIVASQIPRPERLARANEVIDNRGAPDALGPQIKRLHQLYLALAGAV
ncbi:dephospho-CoA kinase [uncultured Thiodictyon sp.]|uniref:dephospho-CoA kinase n=1 Tax=uncultured Thiodictyon sp. TaxID=1846217 RepID=UPI0025D232D8|nr:dephospho-CoA kinase [uncultured Thiodictyon sp.]